MREFYRKTSVIREFIKQCENLKVFLKPSRTWGGAFRDESELRKAGKETT